MNNGSLRVQVEGMILGYEDKVRKSDGSPYRIIRFSDTTGLPAEAIDYDTAREIKVFSPAKFDVTVKWGTGSQYGAYVKIMVNSIDQA